MNISWLQIAGERAKRKLGVKVVIFDPAYMSREIVSSLGWGEVGHAEEIESSHMWHCYPNLVKMDRVKDTTHEITPLYHVDPSYRGDTLCYVPSSVEEQQAFVAESEGTVGKPSKASEDGGKIYHNHLVERLVSVIKKMQE